MQNQTIIMYQPAVYTGPIPPPRPPTQEQLPSELRRQKLEMKAQDVGVKQKAATETSRQPGQTFWNRFSSMMTQAGLAIESSFITAQKSLSGAGNWNTESATRYFQTSFPQLTGEQLWDRGIPCRIASGQTAIPGLAFVTANFFAFKGFGRTEQEVLTFVMPLRMIASIQLATATFTGSPVPELRMINPPTPDTADGLLLYSVDQRVHQLFGFANTKYLRELYVVLDRAWHHASSVQPLEQWPANTQYSYAAQDAYRYLPAAARANTVPAVFIPTGPAVIVPQPPVAGATAPNTQFA